MKVQKGDVIRAYDFKPMTGRGDCFVEGVVEELNSQEHGYDSYKITVTKHQFGPEVYTTPGNHAGPGQDDYNRVGKIVFVPKYASFMEYDGRILNLSR